MMKAKPAKSSKAAKVEGATGKLAAAIRSCIALVSSPRTGVVFPRILQVAARMFPSDAYALWERKGEQWRIALAEGLSERYLDSGFIARYQQHGTLRTVIAEDVRELDLVADRRRFYTAEGIKAFAAAPIFVRQELRGTITFYFRKRKKFSAEDRALVGLVADLAAAAIGNAELYEAQAKLTAENAEARARYKFLSDISAILASSLDHTFILGELARALVPHIADWCAIDIKREDGTLDRLAVAHTDPDKMRLAREMQQRFPVDVQAGRGLGRVLRTGEAELTSIITEEMIEHSRLHPEQIEILRTLGLSSSIVVAMIARGKVLGALTLVQAESRRHFALSDVPFAQDIANRAALYVEYSRSCAQR